MRNFRKYEIWHRAIALTKEIYKMTESYPNHEKFGIISQMRRAGVSIASNIAEGASRSTEKDFARFLEIALGSAFEVETQLIISVEIDFIGEEQSNRLLSELSILQKQINQFLRKLK